MASSSLSRLSSFLRNQSPTSLWRALSRAYSSGDGAFPPHLTHTDAVTGKASMVDVSAKIMDTGHTLRSATARGRVLLNSESAYRLVRDNVQNKKVWYWSGVFSSPLLSSSLFCARREGADDQLLPVMLTNTTRALPTRVMCSVYRSWRGSWGRSRRPISSRCVIRCCCRMWIRC